jgi:hypothetical protein
MFEAKIWYSGADGKQHVLSHDDIVRMLEREIGTDKFVEDGVVYPTQVSVEILSNDSSKMTLRKSKEFNKFWRSVPLTSTPTSR